MSIDKIYKTIAKFIY